MKRSLTPFIFLILCFGFTRSLSAQDKPAAEPNSGARRVPQSGGELLKLMHMRYFKGQCKSYTFSQRNQHYRNDSVVRRSEWHESVEFPDKFKIIFGDTADGNAVVFKNDTAYNYKKGKLLQSRPDSNMILLFIGGMYYRPFKEVVARMEHAKFNLNVISFQKWKDKEVCIIGAKEGDLTVNQLWVDKITYRVVRIIENLSKDNRMDMSFDAHKAMCKGFIETKVTFKRNGKLEQVEEYYDIKESAGFHE